MDRRVRYNKQKDLEFCFQVRGLLPPPKNIEPRHKGEISGFDPGSAFSLFDFQIIFKPSYSFFDGHLVTGNLSSKSSFKF